MGAIMGLLKKYLLEAISRMERDRVKMEFFGDLSPLPQELQDLCRRTREISKGYDGCQVNVCLNYGGRDELLRAARAYAQDCVEGRADPNLLTAEHFAGYLFSRGVPDPDLVIRPSGELRLSNFLLWQSAYAEFYFTDVLWPDFTKEELHRAIAAYQGRSRRVTRRAGQPPLLGPAAVSVHDNGNVPGQMVKIHRRSRSLLFCLKKGHGSTSLPKCKFPAEPLETKVPGGSPVWSVRPPSVPALSWRSVHQCPCSACRSGPAAPFPAA